MPSRVRSFRADEDVWEKWVQAAKSRGLTLNGWAVGVLSLEAERLEAEERRSRFAREQRDRELRVKRGEVF